MEKVPKALPPSAKHPIFKRRRSFRDIQGVISKMNPEVVKSVIENGSTKSCFSIPSTPNGTPPHHPKLSLRCGGENNGESTAPMTIFYNGKVLAYDVSPHQAQGILKVAEEIFPTSVENFDSEKNLLNSLNGDFPIFRRNSLQRFLEKRKERLTVV
ncbi:hypothetical protein ACS0TY_010784 [Phlomoides rotata]